MNRRVRSAWIAGLAVGAAGGVLSLEFPPLGWLIVAAFAAAAAIVGPRIAGFGGLLTGAGAIWIVLLGRVAITCQAPDGEIGCQAPGIEPWLAAGAGMFAVGALLSVWARRGAGGRADRL